MNKEDVIYVHSGILFTIKKNEIMLFAATWMQPEIVILSEASQRKKYHMTSLYMWNHSQTLENKLMAAGGRDS